MKKIGIIDWGRSIQFLKHNTDYAILETSYTIALRDLSAQKFKSHVLLAL